MTNEPFLIFAGILSLFVFFLLAQKIVKLRFCVLCASVFTTWAALLVLYFMGKFSNPLLIAVLMGGSVSGIFYLVEKKTKEELHLFRLPFFLTLVLIAYLLLGITEGIIYILALLFLVWIFFWLLYAYRNNKKVKGLVTHLINCCKNW